MNRREAIQRVAVLMGSAVSAPALVGILEGCKSTADAGQAFALNVDQLGLVSEFAEIIIPKTDTPGAKEAGVGEFIQVMIRDCYSQEQADHFMKGIDATEEVAKSLGGSFASLSEENKIEVVKTMEAKAKTEREEAAAKVIDSETGLAKDDKSKVQPPVPFFDIMKSLTLFGYFTSEVGCKEALEYVPIPGRYDGCIEIKEGQKAYAL